MINISRPPGIGAKSKGKICLFNSSIYAMFWGAFVYLSVCPSVSLAVFTITPKLINTSSWHFFVWIGPDNRQK